MVEVVVSTPEVLEVRRRNTLVFGGAATGGWAASVGAVRCVAALARSARPFPPGNGKTHPAIALGREACRKGRKVRFFTVVGLVNTCIEACEERQITRLENHIRCHDLIIIDELGYIPLDRAGAQHLFGFFSQCYEQTILIVTTNRLLCHVENTDHR